MNHIHKSAILNETMEFTLQAADMTMPSQTSSLPAPPSSIEKGVNALYQVHHEENTKPEGENKVSVISKTTKPATECGNYFYLDKHCTHVDPLALSLKHINQ